MLLLFETVTFRTEVTCVTFDTKFTYVIFGTKLTGIITRIWNCYFWYKSYLSYFGTEVTCVTLGTKFTFVFLVQNVLVLLYETVTFGKKLLVLLLV